MGFTWDYVGRGTRETPRIICAFYAWAFPPWVLPMHIMRGFSHVKYAHFCPRIKCAFYAWAFPTRDLPMHNMHGFSHVFYTHFCPCIKCAFFTWAFPQRGLPMHNMRGFSHVYYAHFCAWECPHLFPHILCVGTNVGIPTMGFAHA